MKIGFDRDILRGPRTGIGNYCFQMIAALTALDDDIQFFTARGFRWHPLLAQNLAELSAQHSNELIPSYLRARLSKIRIASTAYRTYRRLLAESTYRTRQLSLFHAFNYLPLAKTAAPMLPVVYDLSFIRFPETHPLERLRWLSGLDKVLAEAPMIQTISEFSRTEISRHYGYPRKQIFVAYPAASSIFRPMGEAFSQLDLSAFSLIQKQYFLAVGTLEPRKNLKTLIAAYAMLPKKLRQNFPMVLVGHSGWGNMDLPRETSQLLADGTLRFLGVVSDAQLRSLYEGARALLFPSIYEGFGMPVVEALACGTHVIHTKDTSMDEITGLEYSGIPALDVDAWKQAMMEASELSKSEISAGSAEFVKLASAFDWRASATRVNDAYHELVYRS